MRIWEVPAGTVGGGYGNWTVLAWYGVIRKVWSPRCARQQGFRFKRGMEVASGVFCLRGMVILSGNCSTEIPAPSAPMPKVPKVPPIARFSRQIRLLTVSS